MNVDKARKRIAKQVKKGFKGYPLLTLAYSGPSADLATRVEVTFIANEGEEPQRQYFSCEQDIRQDQSVQSVLLKIIERAAASSVLEVEGISILVS